MTKVHVTTMLNAPAAEVWGLVGRWNALHEWHPAVVKSELSDEGRVRRLTLAGGGIIEERLEVADEGRRTLTYALIAGPLPVANYQATITVKDEASDAASIEWSSDFDASGATEAEAREVIRQIYAGGLDNLKRLFRPSS